MKKTTLIQAVVGFAALVATAILPYYAFSVLGIPLYTITPVFVMGLYPVFLVPIFAALAMALLAFTENRKLTASIGIIALLINIVFLALRLNIVMSGDIQTLLSMATILAQKISGTYIDFSELRVVLMPLLHPGVGLYLVLFLDIVYCVLSVLPLSEGHASAGKANRTSGNSGNRYSNRSF